MTVQDFAEALFFFENLDSKLSACERASNLTKVVRCREEKSEGGIYGIGMTIESNHPHFVQGIHGLEVRSLMENHR
jgi:hypothetical protein